MGSSGDQVRPENISNVRGAYTGGLESIQGFIDSNVAAIFIKVDSSYRRAII